MVRMTSNLPKSLTKKLGKESDRSLAFEHGVSVERVRKERILRGILPAKSLRWTPEKIAVLGTMPDKKAAELVGVTNSAAFTKRVSLGIPAFGKSLRESQFHWTASGLRRLGVVSDGVLARELGVSENTVTAKRHSLGIGASRGDSVKRRPWTKKELAMLGKKPDTVVSRETKRGRRHVRAKRESLGIPAFQQQKTITWTKAIIKRFSQVTNKELAEELGVSEGTVALHRRRLSAKQR